MEKLLFVNACVRPESRTFDLARCVLDRWQGEVERLDLAAEDIQPLDLERLEARSAAVAEGKFDLPMLRYARQFAQADVVLMAAPFWDLSFPAWLKLYLEAITVTGLTFRYTPEGWPQGLCKARKLIYVTTAGGPTEGMDFGYPYVQAMARGFFGIPEVVCFKAENLDIVGMDVEAILAQTRKEIEESEI